jgi:hypothetical protein
MHLNTIEQELAKKFENMNYDQFTEFLNKLAKMYTKRHQRDFINHEIKISFVDKYDEL